MKAKDPNEPFGYGPYYTRVLDRGLAYVNADSYTWLALARTIFRAYGLYMLTQLPGSLGESLDDTLSWGWLHRTT